MKHSNSDSHEHIAMLNQVNLVAYMKSLGHEPSFANDEITIFALPGNASRETIVTINNHLNRIEAVRMTSNGNVLDLASLVFKVSRAQVFADPAAYGLDAVFVRGTIDGPDPSTS